MMLSCRGEEVTLRHLVDHSGLGMHYVFGIPAKDRFPAVKELLSTGPSGKNKYDYDRNSAMSH